MVPTFDAMQHTMTSVATMSDIVSSTRAIDVPSIECNRLRRNATVYVRHLETAANRQVESAQLGPNVTTRPKVVTQSMSYPSVAPSPSS
jgi:hypothetical protein